MPPRKKKATRKKAVRKASRTKKVAKKKKTTGKKKAFGGYTINFKSCEDSLEKVFGNKPLPPSEMTKRLWAYVKRKKLNNN